YPAEFMAALLSCEMEDTDRISEHVDDCRRMKIEILPPDINHSEVEFGVLGDKLTFGLGALKGVGEAALHAIVEERTASGLSSSTFSLAERIDAEALDKSVVGPLVEAGALDCLGGRRSQLITVVERAVQASQSRHKDKARGQKNL